MTTHKDRPHAGTCGAIRSGSPCICNGTRWYGRGHRRDDAIAIQGIATFFARLQPAVSAVPFQIAANAVAHVGSANYHYRQREAEQWLDDSTFRAYASPVTPAAQTDGIGDYVIPWHCLNTLQRESIEKMLSMAPQMHMADIVMRIGGEDRKFQCDWIKSMTKRQAEPAAQTVAVPDEVTKILGEMASVGAAGASYRYVSMWTRDLRRLLSAPATPAAEVAVPDGMARDLLDRWLDYAILVRQRGGLTPQPLFDETREAVANLSAPATPAAEVAVPDEIETLRKDVTTALDVLAKRTKECEEWKAAAGRFDANNIELRARIKELEAAQTVATGELKLHEVGG